MKFIIAFFLLQGFIFSFVLARSMWLKKEKWPKLIAYLFLGGFIQAYKTFTLK